MFSGSALAAGRRRGGGGLNLKNLADLADGKGPATPMGFSSSTQQQKQKSNHNSAVEQKLFPATDTTSNAGIKMKKQQKSLAPEARHTAKLSASDSNKLTPRRDNNAIGNTSNTTSVKQPPNPVKIAALSGTETETASNNANRTTNTALSNLKAAKANNNLVAQIATGTKRRTKEEPRYLTADAASCDVKEDGPDGKLLLSASASKELLHAQEQDILPNCHLLTSAEVTQDHQEGPSTSESTMPETQECLEPGVQRRRKRKLSRVVVIKEVDTQTFWAACRACSFGMLLIALGIAMATIGYYADHFATEILRNGTVTEASINPSTRLQYMSLQYIGPIVMGVGAFLLMIACVITLESRDKNARTVHESHFSRKRAIRKRSREAYHREKAAVYVPGSSSGVPAPPGDFAHYANEVDATCNAGMDLAATAKPQLVASSSGLVNRCFTREESKTTTKIESDSSPPGTATTHITYLTLSKNLRDIDKKCPSASHIDIMSRQSDPKILLQRFLEDQSRLVLSRQERRSRRRSPNVMSLEQNSSENRSKRQKIDNRSSINSPRGSLPSTGYDQELLSPLENNDNNATNLSSSIVAEAEIHFTDDQESPAKENLWHTSGDDQQYLDMEKISDPEPQFQPEKPIGPAEKRIAVVAPIVRAESLEIFSPLSTNLSVDSKCGNFASAQELERNNEWLERRRSVISRKKSGSGSISVNSYETAGCVTPAFGTASSFSDGRHSDTNGNRKLNDMANHCSAVIDANRNFDSLDVSESVSSQSFTLSVANSTSEHTAPL